MGSAKLDVDASIRLAHKAMASFICPPRAGGFRRSTGVQPTRALSLASGFPISVRAAIGPKANARGHPPAVQTRMMWRAVACQNGVSQMVYTSAEHGT